MTLQDKKKEKVENERETPDHSEGPFRKLFIQMPTAVAIYEATGDGADFIIKDFNPAAESIEGVKKIDLVGKPVTKVFPGIIEFGLFNVLQEGMEDRGAGVFPCSYLP